jgi:hypothetical protein
MLSNKTMHDRGRTSIQSFDNSSAWPRAFRVAMHPVANNFKQFFMRRMKQTGRTEVN